jgi:hypothetical protein
MSGKGDKRRPIQISDEEMDDNWGFAFKRKKQNAEKSRYKRKQREEAIEPKFKK